MTIEIKPCEYKALLTIKSEYDEYRDEKAEIEMASLFSIEDGVWIYMCYGHDNEIFEDKEAIKIPLKSLLDGAVDWANVEFRENHSSFKMMASYLRMLADYYELTYKEMKESK